MMKRKGSSNMKFVCGVEGLGFPDMFSRARKRIILHAAVYGPFARSKAHRAGLEEALSRSSFNGLNVITLQPGCDQEWSRPFMGALRFGISRHAVADELNRSADFLFDLSESYPGKVNIFFARNLPCFPVVIVDDLICFGQYAHAEVHAPQGVWGSMEADVERLFSWAESGRIPMHASVEETAAFRIVCECARAMKCGLDVGRIDCDSV